MEILSRTRGKRAPVMSLDLLQNALQAIGHEVVIANNGHEACKVLEQDQIRLVVSDWEMPGMNGLELCQVIRSGNYDGYIYFVMLTSHSDRNRMVEGLTAGADDFLSKPFSVDVLIT